MSDKDMAHYGEKYFANRDTYFEGGEETSIDMDDF